MDKEFLKRIYGAIGDDTQNDGWLYEFVWQDHYLFTDFAGEWILRFVFGPQFASESAVVQCSK